MVSLAKDKTATSQTPIPETILPAQVGNINKDADVAQQNIIN